MICQFICKRSFASKHSENEFVKTEKNIELNVNNNALDHLSHKNNFYFLEYPEITKSIKKYND